MSARLRGDASPGRQALVKDGLPTPPAKLRSPASSKASHPSGPRPDLRPASVLDHLRRDPGPDDLAGVDRDAFQRCVQGAAFDLQGRDCTEHQFVGRFWERYLHEIPEVQRQLGEHLCGSLDQLRFFLEAIHGAPGRGEPTGFFDANGRNVLFGDRDRTVLQALLEHVGSPRSTAPAELARAGIVYADRFTINGRDFVDGAFLLPFRDQWIVLLRVEAKTIGSPGVDAQLGSFFVRLAASRPDDMIECHVGGQKIPLDRTKTLFNPTWTDSGVGVQQWWQNDYAMADARRADAPGLVAPGGMPGKSLDSRAQSGARDAQRRGVSNDFNVAAGDASGLSRLAVSGDVIYQKADLAPLRAWIRRLAQSRPR